MNKLRMASQHDFSMVPRSDIPRSTYMLQQARKTTFNGGRLIPIYCEEMLPGDHFRGHGQIFARLATPITPVMDNAELETFFFFVPNRLVWEHWEEFISGGNYNTPIVQSPVGGFAQQSLYDQFGLPTVGQIDPAEAIQVQAMPLRAYNLIWNEWFRDQNLMAEQPVPTGDGPDPQTNYALALRAKKHDYFTSCLPWPQKGTAVSLPLGTQAPVYGTPGLPMVIRDSGGTVHSAQVLPGATTLEINSPAAPSSATWNIIPNGVGASGVYADLSAATASTINAIRTAFQVQRLLERDARGGSRYVEQLLSHFGVRSPDYRLQRPEYIGGGRNAVTTSPIAQTSSTDATSPQGNLAAMSTIQGGGHRFSYAATEHGYIIGLAQVRVDLTYQQGIRRHWSRRTRYDFYFPVFAHLGEQAVLNKEIYATGKPVQDAETFGYQERWAEYRYTPNEICSLFRGYSTGSIDIWHYGEKFGSLPTLSTAFIQDVSQAQLERSMAVGDDANGQQILFDSLFRVNATRPMPTYSVPGLVDHF